jgi:transposase
MKQTLNLQSNYSATENGYQLWIPLDCSISIPEDDPVRLLNAVAERMDYREIEAAYSRYGRIEYSPKILTKVIIYGYMRRIISSREIERACKENICFMYLLEGKKAPDHNTISRFRSNILLKGAGEKLRIQLIRMLIEAGMVDLKTVFIDGTKIEANANKYSFVWKKAQVKKMTKLNERIKAELPELLKKAGIRFYIRDTIQLRHLKKLMKQLKTKVKDAGNKFVYGKGNHKTILQRLVEKIEDWISKYKQYIADVHICGDRNSYSKTDHDATFMHMKEDYMRNGQLKPGYNVNVATSNEFIIGTYISADRSDIQTLIPFMKQLKKDYKGYDIGKVVVDSGYESEENYCWFEDDPVTELFVKPSNHEAKNAKKYRTDISRRENMVYDPEADAYTCAEGKLIRASYEKHSKSASGLDLTTTVYECSDCDGCPLKGKCIRSCGSKRPLEERHKVLYVSKRFARQREEMEK